MEPWTGLVEYTIELETRPMVSLDPEDLDRLQESAETEVHMSDPVFGLDESKGSILAVFQVWAATAALAVAFGGWLFFNTMVRAGFDVTRDTVEMISVQKTASEEYKLGRQLVTLPSKEDEGT